MTDEELAAIDKAWHTFRRVELYRGDPDREAALKNELVNHIPALLAEVEQIRAIQRDTRLSEERQMQRANRLYDENAAMREIVQAVAQADWDECYGHWACPLGCTGKFTGDDTQVPPDLQHEPDCPVTKARALLGTD